jgi:hypothetical protein
MDGGRGEIRVALRYIMSKDLLYKVAYDEAVRALAKQQAVIDSFRNRAGLLFSAAAVTASLFGPTPFGAVFGILPFG